jgi:CRISPR/Cas system CSM-associated protein Csm3 (group 7 of RAMP superfamily)
MNQITFITAELSIDAPWCVGSPENATSPSHLPCATDPFGTVIIPASSIAGSLRDHLRTFEGLDVVEVMGGSSSDDEDDLLPSPVRLVAVEVSMPAGTGVSSRTQTAIDPRRGAAENHMLRTSDFAPAGTTVAVHFRVDGGPDWVSSLLSALATWAPFIGRSRTSGMGAARIRSVHHGSLDLRQPSDLALWLSSGGPDLVRKVAQVPVEIPSTGSRPQTLFGGPLRMRARDAIFISGEAQKNMRTPYTRDGQPVIEGSGWKGLLRSRVGYVVRTLGVTACTDVTGCVDPRCPICLLFGSTTRRGALRLMSTDLVSHRKITRHHVAIDRFTGGAADAKLYGEIDLPVNAELALSIEQMATDLPAWTEPLVAAALLDIHDGYAGIGAKVTSGYGTVQFPEDTERALRALVSHQDGAWVDHLQKWSAQHEELIGGGD